MIGYHLATQVKILENCISSSRDQPADESKYQLQTHIFKFEMQMIGCDIDVCGLGTPGSIILNINSLINWRHCWYGRLTAGIVQRYLPYHDVHLFSLSVLLEGIRVWGRRGWGPTLVKFSLGQLVKKVLYHPRRIGRPQDVCWPLGRKACSQPLDMVDVLASTS